MRVAFPTLLAGLLGACTSLFALDDVENASDDADRDGIRDSDDNCTGLANSEQVDIDADGIGDLCDQLICPPEVEGFSVNRDVDRDGVDDGCDRCLRGPDDDEDGDAIPDACDTCPGISDADQIDNDDDTIGNACDAGSSSQESRLFFDGFASTDHGWIDPAWTVAAGVLSPGDGALHQHLSINNTVVFGNAWYVELGIKLPLNPTANDHAFIVLEDTNGSRVNCGLQYNETLGAFELWSESEVGPLNPFFVAPRTFDAGEQIIVRARKRTAGEMVCEGVGTTESKPTAITDGVLKVKVRVTNTTTRFTHVDVVR